jgi:hypothetical protein
LWVPVVGLRLGARRLAGQVASDYKLEGGRGLVLARFTVVTQGEPGFGAITNPMLVEFREVREPGAWGTPDEHPQGLSLPNPNARVWTSPSNMPTLWEYKKPGLMAASIKPGTYDGLVIAYPDAQHREMPDSIPAPSSGMAFEPVKIPAEAITYIGNIEIRQSYGFWDRLLDRVDVTYAVTDDYDKTVADFRALYPQLRDTPVEKRLAKVVAPAK